MAEINDEYTPTPPTNPNGFDDPKAEYPKKEYVDAPSTNFAALGTKVNRVYTGGGDKNISLGLKPLPGSQYPYNQVRETVSGHVQEIDDTPGAERMLFRHRTGSGVEMRADGTVIISSRRNTIRVTGGDEKVIVEGDGEISYNGNLTLNVSGDFDLVVGGNFNVTTSGDKVEDIHGSYKQSVRKNHKTVVTQNKSDFTAGEYAQTVLGSSSNITKGTLRNYIEGGVEFFSGDEILLTAENMAVITSPNINIGASSLTVIGDSGTIGGDEIIHYARNYYGVSATFDEGVTAPTFHGDLDGLADEAVTADRTNSQLYGDFHGDVGAAAGWSINNVATDTEATVEPVTAIMTDYLHQSSFGVRQVDIDPGNTLKGSIDKSTDYGGVATRELTVAEVRSKLRDQDTLNNETFIGAMIAEGKLNPTYIQAAPSEIGRIVSRETQPKRGTQTIGNRGDRTIRFQP